MVSLLFEFVTIDLVSRDTILKASLFTISQIEYNYNISFRTRAVTPITPYIRIPCPVQIPSQDALHNIGNSRSSSPDALSK